VSARSWFSCEEAFRRLDDYLDRALDPGELRSVEEHLENCVRCTREFRFEQTLLSEVKAKLRQLRVPASLVERVTQRLIDLQDSAPDALVG